VHGNSLRPPRDQEHRRQLIAEIKILERLFDFQTAGDGDCRLQVVALFAADPQLFALDRHLDLELAVLEFADQLLG